MMLGVYELVLHPHLKHVALRNAITALHQYKALQVQGAIDKETIERLRQTHERHAHVKQMDLDTAMIVERNMLLGQEKMREDYEAYVPSPPSSAPSVLTHPIPLLQ